MSSTFTDLKAHRAALMEALETQGLHPVAMEQDAARPDGTVITSSMEKVRDAAAYACIIGRRYGQVPEVPENPDRVSVTELEFREARRLGRPMILFVMGENHPIRYADIEGDPVRRDELDRFREEAKRTAGGANRVYYEFNSLDDFRVAAVQSAADLRRLLDDRRAGTSASRDGIPQPLALYAEPPYIGSHEFVGRAAQLQIIDDWAAVGDPHPVLLFEAIGGTGKSMLTWEWTTRHAPPIRADWAGVFWYSFYERGAIMADFCRRALTYMTGRSLAEFQGLKQPMLTKLLQQHLRERPWLLIMDGLERVLVAYHRADAAQLADEDAGTSDQIAERDPCAAIRPRDDELLRSLAAAGPSKILISSRLIPVSLLNAARQPIPGVRQESLPGLRPADAEALLRSCGVRGDGARMRAYLQANCDCHPLVTGIVGGLIRDYLPARGDFDAWAADAGQGGHLNLADLDLVQKRNHILRAAVEALSEPSRKVLSMIALLSDAIGYETLGVLVPDVDQRELSRAVLDLERRGLLQFDHRAKRYDLHPVVRSVAAGMLRIGEKEALGQIAVDYFSQRAPAVFDSVLNIDELQDTLAAIRVLLQMGHFSQAYYEIVGGLSNTIIHRFEEYAELLSLLRPFFASDWSRPWADVPMAIQAEVVNIAGSAFIGLQQVSQALKLAQVYLDMTLSLGDSISMAGALHNISTSLLELNELRSAIRIQRLQVDVSHALGREPQIFMALLGEFRQFAVRGIDEDAARVWRRIDSMNRPPLRQMYRPGHAEYLYCSWLLSRDCLTETELAVAETLAGEAASRRYIRGLRSLRGRWHASRGEWKQAAGAFESALVMAREAGRDDAGSEAGLALARFNLGRRESAAEEASRIHGANGADLLAVAELWQALGNVAKATAFALDAYRWAWADGGDCVRRYNLDRARALLVALGLDPPSLPVRAEGPEFPWEQGVRVALTRMRADQQP